MAKSCRINKDHLNYNKHDIYSELSMTRELAISIHLAQTGKWESIIVKKGEKVSGMLWLEVVGMGKLKAD